MHVCRNWRIVVFGSPRRLALRIYCDYTTPVREKLHIWPLLPIVVRLYCQDMYEATMDNIVGALEHNDRICECKLELFDSQILEFQKSRRGNPAAIPGTDMSASFVCSRNDADPPRFVLGWIFTRSARTLLGSRSIFGTTKPTFICHSPRQSSSLGFSFYRVHFTRDNRHLSPRVDQTRNS